MEESNFEVVIVGGSYAGLSAAMALGRALRKVLIIDSGKPCNRQTPYSHNFLTRDGQTPAEIGIIAREQVLKYDTVKLTSDTVADITGINNNFKILTENGDNYTAQKILFATGIKDNLPDIPGFSECWGISVIHCPYCHGYEYRGQETGVLVNGEMAIDFIKLIDNWTQKLTLFTNGKATFDKEQFDKIANPNFKIVEKKITEIVHENGHINEILFEDGTSEKLDALYARIPFEQTTNIPARLGCEITEMGYLKVREFNKTNMDGVYAAGDNISRVRSVAISVASGTTAGAFLNHELISEQYQ